MKRNWICPVLLLLLALLSGCADMDDPGPATPDNPPQIDAPMVDPIPTPALLRSFSLPYYAGDTLDPVTCPDGPHQVIGALLYEGLYALDEQFAPQPMLAEKVAYDPENLLYTVTLRDGVTFSDGTPLTAADVAATLERARWSPRYAGRLSDMASVRARDGEVIIALYRPNASFATRLDIPIVKAGTEGDPVPVGTGRYVWVQEDDGAHLEQNERSWRHLTLPLDQIPLIPCKDEDAMAYAFFSHEIQLVTWDLTGTVVFNATGANSYTDAPTPIMQYVGFNTDSPLFSDPALRTALSLGIDRAGCVEAYLLNHAVPAAFPLSPASELYPAELERAYSPDDFGSAMEEAGFAAGRERTAKLIVSAENTFRVQMARQIAADLSGYDVKITVEVLPWAEFQAALADGNYDLYYAECKLPADWDLTALLTPGGALNFSGYTDEELPGLLEAAATATETRRAAALRSLYTHLQNEAPFIPVCFKNVSVLLPDKAVKIFSPTAADPFYHLEDWIIQWAED